MSDIDKPALPSVKRRNGKPLGGGEWDRMQEYGWSVPEAEKAVRERLRRFEEECINLSEDLEKVSLMGVGEALKWCSEQPAYMTIKPTGKVIVDVPLGQDSYDGPQWELDLAEEVQCWCQIEEEEQIAQVEAMQKMFETFAAQCATAIAAFRGQGR